MPLININLKAMKTSIHLIMTFIFLIGLTLLISCNEENGTEVQTPVMTGKLINNSACKSELKSSFDVAETADSLSCVQYSFDEANNQLTLTHINAGFNCCPDSIYVHTSLNGDTIIIEEYEIDGLCDCNCLYDLEIELDGVETKKYQIKFIEPYADSQQEILFEADLADYSEGEFCVTRKAYPWGIESDQ